MIRSRWKWVLLGAVVLLVVAELGLSRLQPSIALVRIVNRGEYPITDLVLSSGSSQVRSTRIEPGQDEVFRLSGRGKQPLVLRFHQFNNPTTDFEVPDFNARQLHRESSILVLELRPNEIVRYQEPDDAPSRWERLGEKVRKSLDEAKIPDSPP